MEDVEGRYDVLRVMLHVPLDTGGLLVYVLVCCAVCYAIC